MRCGMLRNDRIDPFTIDWELVDEGMRKAVQRAVWEHKQLGYPIYAMKDGRMQCIPPEEIDVEKPPEDDSPRGPPWPTTTSNTPNPEAPSTGTNAATASSSRRSA